MFVWEFYFPLLNIQRHFPTLSFSLHPLNIRENRVRREKGYFLWQIKEGKTIFFCASFTPPEKKRENLGRKTHSKGISFTKCLKLLFLALSLLSIHSTYLVIQSHQSDDWIFWELPMNPSLNLYHKINWNLRENPQLFSPFQKGFLIVLNLLFKEILSLAWENNENSIYRTDSLLNFLYFFFFLNQSLRHF